MRNKLLLALCIVALLFTIGATQTTPKPQQWEYKVEYAVNINEKKLNEIGAQGWELVATSESSSSGVVSTHTFLFKRPK